MNILFCCEGFIIDGVASFNLHLSACLKASGHKVAVLGRWLGFNGYQERHRGAGVEVLQYVSPSVVSGRALELAGDFSPDVIISDGRRAFPLALAIHRKYGTPIVTNFLDAPGGKNKPGRTIEEIHDNSAAWVTCEQLQFDALKKLSPAIPVRLLRRAVSTVLLPPTPIPPKDPFHVLCMGRVSRYKYAGMAEVIKQSRRLLSEIPSICITVVGGGWRKILLQKEAALANLAAGKKYVKVIGYRRNPSPFIEKSTLVVGGASCALEAILSNRPAIAVSYHWFGSVTPENLQEADDCFYGERRGKFIVKDNPCVVPDEIISVYKNWNESEMRERTEALRAQLFIRNSPEAAVGDWERLFTDVL